MDKITFKKTVKDNLENSYQIMIYIYKNYRNYFSCSLENTKEQLKTVDFLKKLKEFNIIIDMDFAIKIFEDSYIKLPLSEKKIIDKIRKIINKKHIEILDILNSCQQGTLVFYFYSIVLTYDDFFIDYVFDFLKNEKLSIEYMLSKDFNLKNENITKFKIIYDYNETIEELFDILEELTQDNDSLSIINNLRIILNC